MITLRRLDASDQAAYGAIHLPPEQVVFGGEPGDAFINLPPTMDLYGIEEDGAPVGVFRIDRAYEAHDFARAGEVGLRFFIVDHARQGRGIARGALMALPGVLARDYPNAPSIALTVNCRNDRARDVYAACGFSDTGALYHGGIAGPQHIMRMRLSAACAA